MKPKELCPDSTTKYIRSPTLLQAIQKIKTLNFSNPKNFILHCGTNDIEQPGKDTITDTLKVIDLIKQKYPNCRILVSSLLPRKDELNNKVPTFNEELKTRISNKENTTFIHHTSKLNDDLYDKKHLNNRGVKNFAKNIKAAYFNTTPRNKNTSKKMKEYTPRGIHNRNSQQHTDRYQNRPSQFGDDRFPPPFIPGMNLPRPNTDTNIQLTSKGTKPFLYPDTQTNPLPSHLVGLIRQLYGCINI